ncbi:hypothetical protein KIW84_040827 [Lathyrus oleraceus]|uniref:Reverse transcriptase zinc-binding domain-containing protein n=1 Tax=Pisum sativum TaxID=3888 RepID=A0A9D4X8J6_PEA|nr:hypothetical protein KIW84_040827 [Pisum sativum]
MVVNCIVVTLIPNFEDPVSIKDYGTIDGCTTVYNTISRILTVRLSKVIGSIVSPCQAAFIPDQQIHNHILFSYELIKGYSRNGVPPKCMIQLGLQKTKGMASWLACHGRLPMKGRLCRFGLIEMNNCCVCCHEETLDRLFYGCSEFKAIWLKILEWIQVDHDPKEWRKELVWIVSRSKGKGWRASILKLVIT